ncbi:MAG TPA: hypothetical protein VNQ76_02715 [Planctomicrobium sp.]|nr:hypothetical protein [Planctomicrobium sp.]
MSPQSGTCFSFRQFLPKQDVRRSLRRDRDVVRRLWHRFHITIINEEGTDAKTLRSKEINITLLFLICVLDKVIYSETTNITNHTNELG